MLSIHPFYSWRGFSDKAGRKTGLEMELLGQLNDIERSYEDLDGLECSPVHAELTKRMRKTLYAGKADSGGISLPLTDIVVELFENVEQGHFGQLSKRHVANLTRRSNATQCSLFLSMMYTKRLRECNPEYVTRIKPAELFLVSMMIATKFLYDEGEEEELYNDEWAEAAKIDVNRVHDLEREFLAAIDWKLLVDPLDFYEFLLGVETRIALSEGRKRGWFSYTDLSVLMQHPAWCEACCAVMHHMVKVLSICMLVYSLCAATTMWSALLLHQASIPSQPTNGCLPLPLGPHLAKSTESFHIYNHLLLDLVLQLYMHQDPGMPSVLSSDFTTPHCSVPWYEREHQALSREGKLLESPDDVSQQASGEDTCQHCLNQQRIQDGGLQQGSRKCCALSNSWSWRDHKLSTKITRLRESLVMFYSALLTAWSDQPPPVAFWSDHDILNRRLSSKLMHPTEACTHCQQQSTANQNSTHSALGEPHEACCQTFETFPERDPLQDPRCSQTSCRDEKRVMPSLLSDPNGGFRTSSEILVTM
ncbi:protein CNPPD1-like [Patiria miniata]|uniref:Protein CNPPD1 n=1 Tax=Patiria miniata TaxID=46514 RepID=A0A914B7G5_PATMI|nr:protein CNPPD1-like [Patiria miniata]